MIGLNILKQTSRERLLKVFYLILPHKIIIAIIDQPNSPSARGKKLYPPNESEIDFPIRYHVPAAYSALPATARQM